MTGPVMLSGHPDYDGARRIWNGMHDKRPALIARCLNNDDVSNAVTFARERNLLVAVRGGALLSHLDRASLPHGLVTTAGVVSHTGVGGFTLGGGFGRLNRKCGLAIDNLCSAEIITAFGHGVRSYAKNGMVKEWSQGLVDSLIEADDPRILSPTTSPAAR